MHYIAKTQEYALHNIDYRLDVSLCMRDWKGIIKKETDERKK